MVSYGVEGHSTVHAKCDLIYGSGTGEWVEWEWTGCPGIGILVQMPFLIIYLESCELDSFLLSFEPTTGYEQRPNVVVTQPKQAFQNNT